MPQGQPGNSTRACPLQLGPGSKHHRCCNSYGQTKGTHLQPSIGGFIRYFSMFSPHGYFFDISLLPISWWFKAHICHI